MRTKRVIDAFGGMSCFREAVMLGAWKQSNKQRFSQYQWC